MTQHVHVWIADHARGRYLCACGVIGCRRGSKIVAFACQHEIAGRKHCGADAVHVTSIRTQSRCAEHAPPGACSSTSERPPRSAPTRTQPSTACSTKS